MVGSPATSIQSKATVIASTGASTLHTQAKVVTPSQAGMVVTQLAPGISLRPGKLCWFCNDDYEWDKDDLGGGGGFHSDLSVGPDECDWPLLVAADVPCYQQTCTIT